MIYYIDIYNKNSQTILIFLKIFFFVVSYVKIALPKSLVYRNVIFNKNVQYMDKYKT